LQENEDNNHDDTWLITRAGETNLHIYLSLLFGVTIMSADTLQCWKKMWIRFNLLTKKVSIQANKTNVREVEVN